jgi:stage III sporulation protein AG
LKQVDHVEVLVMVEASPEKQYLTETETVEISNQSGTTTTTTTKVVYRKDGSSSSPIETMIVYPKIKGVLIFINKLDASTKLAIASSVASVLNIESSCISILQDR